MDLRTVGRRLWVGLQQSVYRAARASVRGSAISGAGGGPEAGADAGGDTTAGGRAASDDEQRAQAVWTSRIQSAGLSAEWAARLVPGLRQAQRELGRGADAALLRGALVAMAAQSETQAHVERSLRDVREVERLLGAFTGELEKLDEVLEVLSAYAQRMRPNKPAGPGRRLLH